MFHHIDRADGTTSKTEDAEGDSPHSELDLSSELIDSEALPFSLPTFYCGL